MPQLDIATFLPQLAWLAVTFIILFVVMRFIGLPRVGSIITRRRERIEGDLDKAQRMKAEAEAVIAAYEKALAEARAKAQAVMRETAEQLNAEAAVRNKELAEKLHAETAAAEKRIAAAKSKTLEGLREMALEVARAASAKLVGEADPKRLAASVDAALKERG
ncbi:MAG TPA: F0F1 ATP synthase subunit B' [Stellaceae bacterium]|jgi:F-type H+-transporting ATPase subunit b|nr:F0F1 ATP synthase subunit B' [Stellaceae bacterium]